MSKEQKRQAFYTQSSEEVLKNLETSEQGLTSNEAAKRLDEYGRNELDEGEKKSLLMKFVEQFKDLMILILLIAAILSVVTSGGEDIADAIIILAVVIINAIFGVYQEGKAEEAIEALKSMSSPAARVLRDGHVTEVDSKELVPGDIVILEAGDVVPADMRLLEANTLKIEEAALTGESVPVEKHLTVDVAADAGLGDRINMAFQNSNVTYGRGMGVVVNTGMYTEVGHIAGMLQNADFNYCSYHFCGWCIRSRKRSTGRIDDISCTCRCSNSRGASCYCNHCLGTWYPSFGEEKFYCQKASCS